jgi:myo-inositol-1-phosphate synthase
MSKYIVDIHGDIEGDYEIVRKYEEQEPMVEIDLYSVIKQKYIEREVLDKIIEQIKSHLRGVEITLEVLVENDPLRPKMEGAKDTLEECLEIIDKAETEAKDTPKNMN